MHQNLIDKLQSCKQKHSKRVVFQAQSNPPKNRFPRLLITIYSIHTSLPRNPSQAFAQRLCSSLRCALPFTPSQSTYRLPATLPNLPHPTSQLPFSNKKTSCAGNFSHTQIGKQRGNVCTWEFLSAPLGGSLFHPLLYNLYTLYIRYTLSHPLTSSTSSMLITPSLFVTCLRY